MTFNGVGSAQGFLLRRRFACTVITQRPPADDFMSRLGNPKGDERRSSFKKSNNMKSIIRKWIEQQGADPKKVRVVPEEDGLVTIHYPDQRVDIIEIDGNKIRLLNPVYHED